MKTHDAQREMTGANHAIIRLCATWDLVFIWNFVLPEEQQVLLVWFRKKETGRRLS